MVSETRSPSKFPPWWEYVSNGRGGILSRHIPTIDNYNDDCSICYAYGLKFKPSKIPCQSPISDLPPITNCSIQYRWWWWRRWWLWWRWRWGWRWWRWGHLCSWRSARLSACCHSSRWYAWVLHTLQRLSLPTFLDDFRRGCTLYNPIHHPASRLRLWIQYLIIIHTMVW